MPLSWDLPLTALVAILVVKEAFVFARAVGRRNGNTATPATQLDIAAAKTEILKELHLLSDGIQGRITEVSERVSRLEGAQEARHPPFGGTGS